MPTDAAVPSADPSDLLFNAQKLDEVINGTAESFVDRRGVERLTLTGALRLIGFEAPVAFASGLAITRSTQTVTNGGNTYHADPASLPFTTTGTFNGAQWRLVSNVSQADLTTYAIPRTGATDLTASFKTAGAWEATEFKLDANALWSLVSSNPTWQADAGDTFSYNRTSNKWSMSVGGVEHFFVTAADGPARSADASTDNGLPRKIQVETMVAAAVAARMQYSLSAVIATTSGTFIDLPPIPSWAKRITLIPSDVSTSGTSGFRLQVYENGALITSGYKCCTAYLSSGSNNAQTTDRIFDTGSSAATVSSGLITLVTGGGNKWGQANTLCRFSDNATQTGAGGITLAGLLTGLRLSTSNGTDVFDGGSISMLVEG